MKSRINSADTCLTLFILSFIIFFSWFTLRQFKCGMWDGYDHGVYRQILWTTLHGKLAWCSFTGTQGCCDLGIHMSPALLFLLPITMFFPFVMTLPILHVVILGIAAFPIYLIAKEKINKQVALLFAIFYLTNTFTIQSVIESFQVRAFAIPLFLFVFYFFIKKKYTFFALFLLLLSLTHEVNCILIFMLGIYIITDKKFILGAAVSILSLSWLVLSIKVLQPYFGCSKPLEMLGFNIGGKVLGDPWEILRYCISHPAGILSRAVSKEKMDYFIRLFLPLGFLPLFSPKELITGLGVFFQNFILSEKVIKPWVPRYSLTLVPTLFISTIYSVSFLFKKFPSMRRAILTFIIISWAISTYRFSWDPQYNPRFLKVLSPIPSEARAHRKALKVIAGLVPSDASVCSDVKAFPYLANRFNLYDLPFHIKESDYLLIDTKYPQFSPKPLMSQGQFLEIMNNELCSPDYETVKQDDGIVLLKRKIFNLQ